MNAAIERIEAKAYAKKVGRDAVQVSRVTEDELVVALVGGALRRIPIGHVSLQRTDLVEQRQHAKQKRDGHRAKDTHHVTHRAIVARDGAL